MEAHTSQLQDRVFQLMQENAALRQEAQTQGVQDVEQHRSSVGQLQAELSLTQHSAVHTVQELQVALMFFHIQQILHLDGSLQPPYMLRR